MLRAQQALPVEPGCRRGPRLGAEAPREGPRRHEGLARELVDGEILAEVAEHPLGHGGERVALALDDRRFDVLRLAAVALRWHDHASGDDVRGRRPELLAHDVQRRIDSGCRPCARHDPPVLDEEHVGVHLGARVLAHQTVGVHPVGRARAPVENAGLAEHERPTADTQHPGSAPLGRPDDVKVALVDSIDRVCGHGDEIGVGRTAQVVVDHEVESEARRDTPRRCRDDGEVEYRPPAVAAVDPEDLADDPEFERRRSGDGEQGDLAQHGKPPGRNQTDCGNTASCGSFRQHIDFLP